MVHIKQNLSIIVSKAHPFLPLIQIAAVLLFNPDGTPFDGDEVSKESEKLPIGTIVKSAEHEELKDACTGCGRHHLTWEIVEMDEIALIAIAIYKRADEIIAYGKENYDALEVMQVIDEKEESEDSNSDNPLEGLRAILGGFSPKVNPKDIN